MSTKNENNGGSESWNADLLNAFIREVPSRPERRPTFMEISGYPHYENVCSNILAFFFDPKKPHGLGTLFMDAIARVGSVNDRDGAVRGEIKVDREVQTGSGNFMDIILLSDSHAILIENKIYAPIANPLADYATRLDEYGRKHHYKFLLTLSPVCKTDGFENITYAQFVKEIRGLLGCYIAGADTRYLTFMLDFLNTLDYLHGGKVMNPELVRFLKCRSQDVARFLKDINAFKEELRGKVNGLAGLIKVDSSSNVSQWKYREKNDLFDILGHYVKLPRELVIAVDTIVSHEGWKIEIYPRKNIPYKELGELLRSLNVDVGAEEGEWPVRLAGYL